MSTNTITASHQPSATNNNNTNDLEDILVDSRQKQENTNPLSGNNNNNNNSTSDHPTNVLPDNNTSHAPDHQQRPSSTTTHDPDLDIDDDGKIIVIKQQNEEDNNNKTSYKAADQQPEDDPEEQKRIKFYEDLDLIEAPIASSWLYVQNRPWTWNLAGVLLLIPFGMLEGYGFFRVGIVDPLAFSGQFTLSAWVILNLFIAAVGASMVIFSIFELLVPSFWARKADSQNSKTGYLRAIVGGSLCGVGMALAGVGSTMLPAQVGGGVHNSWASVIGFFLGALVFSIVEKYIITDHMKETCKIDRKVDKLTIDEKVGIRFHKIGIPVGLGMIGFACALEFGIPGTKTQDNSEKLSMGNLPWPAAMGGLVVALNQAVLLLIGNHQQGGSTCIVNVVSLLTGGWLAPQYFPFTSTWKPRWGVHINQFVLVWIGTAVGSKIAEVTAEPLGQHSPTAELPIWRMIVGGFLSIFGARYSDSCACGGLTSVGSLSIEGTLLAMFMFGSAIGTGFVIQAVEN